MSNTIQNDTQDKNTGDQDKSNQGKAPAFVDDKGKPEVSPSIIGVPTAEERRK